MHQFYVLDRDSLKPIRVERLPYDYIGAFYVRTDRYREYLTNIYVAEERNKISFVLDTLINNVELAVKSQHLFLYINAIGIPRLAENAAHNRAVLDAYNVRVSFQG